jgi:hypothetical protein
MSPLTLVTIIVVGQLLLVVRTTKLRPTRVLHLHVDLLRLHVAVNIEYCPRCSCAKHLPVGAFLLHFWMFFPKVLPESKQNPCRPVPAD